MPELDRDRLLLAGRHPLAAVVTAALARSEAADGGLLLAVSGGPDSLALLWLVAAVLRRGGDAVAARVRVGHIDHGLRPESASEAEKVVRWAAAAGLESDVTRLEGLREIPGNRLAAAREARYEALVQLAARHEISSVATAHHREDQVETIVMGLGRGLGLHGAAGMRRERLTNSGIAVVRPLLEVSRNDLGSFCRALDLEPIDDPSNRDARRLRGRMRDSLLPQFEEVLPGFAAGLVRLSAESELALDAIARWLETSLGPGTRRRWSRSELRELPAELVAMGLRRSVRENFPAIGEAPRRVWTTIAEAVLDQEPAPRRWPLDQGARIEVTANEVAVLAAEEPSLTAGLQPESRGVDQAARQAST